MIQPIAPIDLSDNLLHLPHTLPIPSSVHNTDDPSLLSSQHAILNIRCRLYSEGSQHLFQIPRQPRQTVSHTVPSAPVLHIFSHVHIDGMILCEHINR